MGNRTLYDNTSVLMNGKYAKATNGVYTSDIYPQLGPGGNLSDLIATLRDQMTLNAAYDDQQVNAGRQRN
jgi:hypothetical protein